jgi:hypothetical protein
VELDPKPELKRLVVGGLAEHLGHTLSVDLVEHLSQHLDNGSELSKNCKAFDEAVTPNKASAYLLNGQPREDCVWTEGGHDFGRQQVVGQTKFLIAKQVLVNTFGEFRDVK